jgi:hypothetical protein
VICYTAMKLSGDDLQRVFTAALPDDVITKLAKATGLQQRERKLEVVRFIRSMVIAAATGYGGRQADILRLYVENGAEEVVRGGFYAWFGPALEETMKQISDRMLEFVRQQPVDLPGILGEHVQDWHIVDSTTVKLDDALKETYPGTGKFAALKVHKRFSVGRGTTWSYHLSPAKEHDARHLEVDESWRGLGLLVDLGYASAKLISDCQTHGVHFVMRLKDNWKPRVDSISRGDVKGEFFPGTDLDVLIDGEVIRLKDKVVDTQVTIGKGSRAVQCRMVGVPVVAGGYRFYLTSLPGKVGPRQVCDLYRVRWEIESDNKLDKSCHRLDEIGAKTEPAVRALVHASIVSSMMICSLVHQARLREVPPRKKDADRTTPPLHPQTLARIVGSASTSIAAALELTGTAAVREWERLAGVLNHLGFDPNWRRKPSVLDQMRGWKVLPGKPRGKKSADSHAN